MLKIDVIRFEALDVVASSAPGMEDTTKTENGSFGDTTTSGLPGSSGSGSGSGPSDGPTLG